jgi:hypothetical protein
MTPVSRVVTGYELGEAKEPLPERRMLEVVGIDLRTALADRQRSRGGAGVEPYCR